MIYIFKCISSVSFSQNDYQLSSQLQGNFKLAKNYLLQCWLHHFESLPYIHQILRSYSLAACKQHTLIIITSKTDHKYYTVYCKHTCNA